MPTTHVEPGCDPLLQDIANTLWKSRKVVVITGAGISTNSGIPDFRSENGLYSLIQAQFDEAQQQATDSNSDADPSDAIEPRPAKRQRRTYGDSSRQSLGVPEIPFPGLRNAAAKEVEPGIQQHNATKEEQPRSTVVENVSIEVAPFASSPPSLAFATPRPRPPHLLDTLPASSSPLSSPPQVTYDPYQESTNGSSQDTESSRSQSEEPSSVTTPLLSSQNSFISSRNSLPVMKGRDLFDSQIWSCPTKTSVFYTFVSTLREKVRSAEPTSSHRFVSVLRDSRKLVRCYTQNIDQLEERVGLSTSLSLGVGSRYRFSTRSGRNTAGAKGSAKGAEGIPDASQGSSQKDGEQEEVAQSQEQPQPGQAGVDAAATGDASGGLSSTGPISQSQTSSNPAADSEDAPSSTQPASQSTAPAAPNRGVECVFLHGSLAELRCFVCARTASWEEDTRLADTLAGRQPTCPHCAGATAAREERGKRALGVGKLRPDIVLYGEDHPHSHLISPLVQHDLSLGPDMLLILGTSMRVHGLKVLVKEFAKAVHDRGGKVVFVNFTKPPESVWADIIDYWVQWDCDAWVGDLQARKPALWLPPGTSLPEEDKPKTSKLSRRQSGAEGKRKESAAKTSKRGGESDSDGFMNSQKKEPGPSLQLQGPEQGLEQGCKEEMPPPPAKAVPKKAVKVPREPKLNPDAKRPASVRDHKQNGAYLVYKIMDDLRRITGGSLARSAASSPTTTTRPKAKRPRKSAPATLGPQDAPTEPSRVVEARHTPTVEHPTVPASSPAPNAPLRGDSPVRDSASSISAAVKSRKRKSAVTWRMVRGVETRVSLNDVGEPQPRTTPVPVTPAVLPPSPVPVPDSRRLPPPTPTTPKPPPQYHPDPQYKSEPQPAATAPATSAIDMAITAGFRETDRLIAQIHQETRLSRPATPLQLPPLIVPNASSQQQPAHTTHPHNRKEESKQKQEEQYQYHTAKLVPMEPKVDSPGPRKGISSNVGSPVAPGHNPFFMADPLVGWLGYPPVWLQQQLASQAWADGKQQPGQGQIQGQGRDAERGARGLGRPAPLLMGGKQAKGKTKGMGMPQLQPQPQPQPDQRARMGGSGAVSPWCPDEQLRKEQEAAMMLSAMRGTGTAEFR
ncbi:hypothetical protein F5144DRAFT_214746 [Chaetomium tenue]|uniref:Uncharacterized protein n=1 Tax=Chaetomium tenue TaxID=1854479 RepID=A0ACB7P558_9PEZI|nr:hypothetical protein F5144DRAFT_214746 [Chaetomium globosum]